MISNRVVYGGVFIAAGIVLLVHAAFPPIPVYFGFGVLLTVGGFFHDQ